MLPCDACGSDANVVRVDLSYQRSGLAVHLCKSCLLGALCELYGGSVELLVRPAQNREAAQ